MDTDNPMAAQQPSTPPQPASQPAPPQRQPTLEEYAQGVDQLNIELQRQSAAYGHFRAVIAQLDALAQNPEVALNDPLPFVAVRFPQKGPTPGEMLVDLNTLPTATVVQFRPIFELLAGEAGDSLVKAWESVIGVADATRPIIAAAKQANV